MDYDVIKTLASNNYNVLKNDILNYVNDPLFIKKIIYINNPVVFDRFIKMVDYKMDTGKIWDKRNSFVRKIMTGLNIDNCYQFFELDKKKEVLVNRYLIEYIIGYFFQDNYYNFMTNFYQMLSYIRYTDKSLVSKNNIELYNSFIKLKDLSFNDKIKFFNDHLSDGNIMEKFYDDINNVRVDSHKELVNHALKLDKNNSIYQKELSNKYGLDVYYLNGEKFYGFVRCLTIPRIYLFNHFDYVNSEGKRLGYSFSYIGDKNIGTMDYNQESVILFYDKIDYNNIMYVHHADLHSKKMDVQDDYLSNKENEIITPDSLISHTNNYNEIYIKNNSKRIVPTALICYNTITDNDIGFARKYNLSILVINKDKYKRYEKSDEDYDSYSYVI